MLIDCDNPQEEGEIQRAFDKLSPILDLKAKSIIKVMPMLDKGDNQNVLKKMFYEICQNGMNPIAMAKVGALGMKLKK